MPETLDSLTQKYEDFMKPTIELNIGGTKMNDGDTEIAYLEVQLSTGIEASACQIVFANQYDISTRSFDSKMVENVLKPGNDIEVKLGYIATEVVFKGYIDTVRLFFSESNAPEIVIECLDAKGMMMHGVKSQAYANDSYAGVVQKIIGKYGISQSNCEISSTTKLEREIQQNGETDFTFLSRMAKTLHFEFFINNGKFYFRKPPYEKKEVSVVMGFNQLLTRFSTTCKLSSYIDKVIVKGYSDSEHKVVMGMADKIEKVGEGKELVSYASKLKKTETILLDYEINSEEEAKVRAQAELDRRSMAFVKGAGRCIGVPEVVPGAYIEIKDFDETVDNLYYVTKVVHKMTDGNYYTEFEAGANHI